MAPQPKDPLGFLGSHIIRKLRGEEEHGWLTRYDDQFDRYTLFVPGKGAQFFTRGDVLSFISDPDVEIRTGAEDTMEKPMEDTITSRFMNVPVIKMKNEEEVHGAVVAYLPFDDQFRVKYDDKSYELMTEDEIINSLITMVKSERHGRSKKRKRQAQEHHTASPPSKRAATSVVAGMAIAPQETQSVKTEQLPPAKPEQPEEAPVLLQEEDHIKTEEPTNVLDLTMGLEPEEPEEPPAPTQDVVDLVDESEPMEELVFVEEDDASEDPEVSPSTTTPTADTRPFYLIELEPHVPVEPFDRRQQAYSVLRSQLCSALSHEDAARRRLPMHLSILENPDIKDRDACQRFMESKGLIVLNDLLKGAVSKRQYDDLLWVVKLIAMLPPPTHHSVAESSIGLMIGRLARSKEEKHVPKCIKQLAGWIKSKWLKHLPQHVPKASLPSRHKAGRPSKRPERRLNESSARPANPPSHRTVVSSPERIIDTQPIPRRKPPPAPTLSAPSPPPPPPPAPSAPKPSVPIAPPIIRKRNLKPDWMIAKENLSKTRFAIQTDAQVEKNHYRRDHRPYPPPSASSSASSASGRRSENDEPAGERGVYGRPQRLSFDSKWNVCEFSKDAAPSSIRSVVNHHSTSRYPPKSILRRQSKYRDDLRSF